jgi:hypothetical protein
VLPPKLQKSVETASKYWSRTRIQSPRFKTQSGSTDRWAEEVTKYIEIYDALTEQAANAEAAIAKGQSHADPTVAAKTKIHVGSFDVVNTGGFDDETMRKAADLVGKAEKLMTDHGLGKVCYGDVLISKTLDRKKAIAAFYLLSSDEMFVRADTPDDWDTVRIVCHELAHRLENKFLSSKSSEIKRLYSTIHTKASDTPLPELGDKVLYEGKQMKVVDTDYRRKSVKVQEDSEPVCFACGKPVEGHQPDAEHKMPIVRRHVYTMPAEVFYKLQGKKLEVRELDFVTHYASTDSSENFAEMVSFYVLGKLPKAQVDLLEPILFQ